MYQVLRSDDRRFDLDCESNSAAQTEWNDPTQPGATQLLFYLHRPTEPLEGSWGPFRRSSP